jgi:quercetin dioxygenase-like cupin family protein
MAYYNEIKNTGGIMTTIDLNEIKEKEIVPGCWARFIHSENISVAYWNIKANYILPEHSHPHEQIVNVIEGKLELTINGKKHIAEPGKVYILPPHVKHSGKGLIDCRVIDVFYPVREDYKKSD